MNARHLPWICALLLSSACQSKSSRTEGEHQSPAAAPDSPVGSPASASSVALAGRPADDHQQQRAVLGQVAIEVAEPPSGAAADLYTRELGKQFGRLLAGSPFFAALSAHVADEYRPRRASAQVRINYQFDDRESDTWLLLTAHSALTWTDGGDDPAPQANVFLERALTAEELANRDGVVAAVAASAIGHVGHQLIAQEQLRVGGADALSSGIASSDETLVLWTLDLIAHRRDPTLFSEVLQVLSAPLPALRERALVALVAIGDPRAVDALAKRASFDDLEFLAQVIDAAIALGGPDAREYLEFIASGHPDASTRARAAAGLSPERPQ